MKEYTEEQKREFRKQYAIRFRRQIVAWGILLAVVLLSNLYFPFRTEAANDVAGVLKLKDSFFFNVSIMLITVAGVLIFTWFNWRCPACNSYLGKVFNPIYCSRCGAQLRVDKADSRKIPEAQAFSSDPNAKPWGNDKKDNKSDDDKPQF